MSKQELVESNKVNNYPSFVLGLFLLTLHFLVFANESLRHTENKIQSRTGFEFATPYFQTIGGAVGEAVKETEVIAQDKRGYLWFGTRHGLVRYDGYHAKVYRHSLDDKHSLAGKWITALWSAPDGKLWVGTKTNGLSIYDPQTDRFINYNQDDNKWLSSNSVTSIVGDPQGNTWIGTLNGLDYWSKDMSVVKHWTHQIDDSHSLLSNSILSLYLDNNKNLWIGTTRGLQRISASTEKMTQFFFKLQNNKQVDCQNILAIFEDQYGKIWVGCNEGWGFIDDKHTPSVAVKIIHQQAMGARQLIVQPSPDQIWLATLGKILTLEPKDGRIINEIKYTPSQEHGLASWLITAAYVDFSGRLWLGAGSRVQNTYVKDHAFSAFYKSDAPKFNIEKEEAWSVSELKNGHIAVGHQGGLVAILDRKLGMVK